MSDSGALPEVLAMMAAASRCDSEACRARADAARPISPGASTLRATALSSSSGDANGVGRSEGPRVSLWSDQAGR